MSDETSLQEIADLFETAGLEKSVNFSGNLDLKFMLKMLTVIYDNFQGGLFFSTHGVLKVPYVLDKREAVKINFSEENQSFQILSKDKIEIKPFESIRIGLNFEFLLDQYVIFEQNEDFSSLSCDIQHQNPSHYIYTNMILHNFSNQILILQADTLLGSLVIKSLQSKFTYIPIPVSNISFDQITQQMQKNTDFNLRLNLSDKIVRWWQI